MTYVFVCGWVTLRHEHAEQNGVNVAWGTNENPPILSSRYLCIEVSTWAAILTSTPSAHPLRTIESIMEGITWETKVCFGSLARQVITLGWSVLHLSPSFLKTSQKEDTVGWGSAVQRDAGAWPRYKPKILTLQPKYRIEERNIRDMQINHKSIMCGFRAQLCELLGLSGISNI